MDKKLKEKLTDQIWYRLTYADGVSTKDLYAYAELITDNILGFLRKNKILLAKEEKRSNMYRIVPYEESEEIFDNLRYTGGLLQDDVNCYLSYD